MDSKKEQETEGKTITVNFICLESYMYKAFPDTHIKEDNGSISFKVDSDFTFVDLFQGLLSCEGVNEKVIVDEYSYRFDGKLLGDIKTGIGMLAKIKEHSKDNIMKIYVIIGWLNNTQLSKFWKPTK